MEWIDGNTFFGSWPKRKLDVDADELVRLLAEAGVAGAATLSLAAPLLEAEEGTRATLEACRAHPELIPFGMIDPRTYVGGDRARELAEAGCRAVRLPNRIVEMPLDFAPVEVIFEECGEAKLPIVLDTTLAGQVTQVTRLAERTGCRVVMCGIGYSYLSEAIICMKRSDLLTFEISRLDTPDGVKLLADEVGAERVLFGSGAPFNYVASAKTVASHCGLSPTQLEWIASRTLLSVLGKGGDA